MHMIRTTALTAISAIAVAALCSCSTVSQTASSTAGGLDTKQAQQISKLDWKSSTLGQTDVTMNGSTASVDVGTGALTIDTTKPLKVAFFNAGSTTTYTQAAAKGAQDKAAELGIDLTVFDGGWDPNTQLSQIENAINGGEYNAIMTYAVDGSGTCTALTTTADAANIPVVPMITPLCGKGLGVGEGLWAPGTASTVMGGGTLQFYEAWADHIASSVTEPTQVLYVAGPTGDTAVAAAEQALKEAEQKYPDFQLVDTLYTDYSTPQGLSSAQNGLLAHPQTKMILSHYTALTQGIVQALKDANRSDVAVYDVGGDVNAVQLINDGSIVETAPYFPYTAAACSVDILNAIHSGTTVPKVALNECVPTADGAGVQTNTFITKENVSTFQPEY